MPSQLFRYNLPAFFGLCLDEAARHGATYIPDVLRLEVCAELRAELGVQAFTTLTPNPVKTVVEDLDILKISLGDPAFPLVTGLGRMLTWLSARHVNYQTAAHSKAVGWLPNEAAAHRYHAGSHGLGAHRDFSSDKLLVAVFTLSGDGGFELLDDDENVVCSWETAPGGLCLMRAPGLTAASDDRPLHRALPPSQGTREALIYRQVTV